MAMSTWADDTSSTQAVNDVLKVIWREFLKLQQLPAGRHLTVPDLLHRLRMYCTAFRFLDLPPELRDMIYGITLEKDDDSDACKEGFQDPLPPAPNRILALHYIDYDPCRTGNPPFLHVSRQCDTKMWLKTIVGEFATHLRDVTVNFCPVVGFAYCETIMQVQFRQSQGLLFGGATGLWKKDWTYNDEFEGFIDMDAYAWSIEQKRIARNPKGEVIVDFFDFGPHEKLVYGGNKLIDRSKCILEDDIHRWGYGW